MPLISVIMAVRNGMDHLPAAMNSLLRQTCRDLEVIVVDDASEDGTGAHLSDLGDPRVRVLRNETNLGLTQSLNRALAVADGSFIARMDADDIAHPERFERQIDALRARPDLAILGCNALIIDEADRPVGHWRSPLGSWLVDWTVHFQPPFMHPSVMIRREGLPIPLSYDPAFRTTQDYDLWARRLPGVRGDNLGQDLMFYRRSAGAVSQRRREEQLATHLAISARVIAERRGDVGLPEDEAVALTRLFAGLPRAEDEPSAVALTAAYLRLLAAHLGDLPATAPTSRLKTLACLQLALPLLRRDDLSPAVLALLRQAPALPAQIARAVAQGVGRRIRRFSRPAIPPHPS